MARSGPRVVSGNTVQLQGLNIPAAVYRQHYASGVGSEDLNEIMKTVSSEGGPMRRGGPVDASSG